MNKIKKTILNFLGVITTAATLAVIYFVLFMTGVINGITQATIIEYTVMLILSLSTKMFWYTSIEHSIRESKDYAESVKKVTETMDDVIEDTFDFDRFIEYENINNYNIYVNNHCKGLTANNYNYTFTDKVERVFRAILHDHKQKSYYASRYIHRIEAKANKLHKLSSANILTFGQSIDGLTDDRNLASKQKAMYIFGGSVLSAIFTFVTAMIGFSPKDGVDQRAAIIKMVMYSSQIIMSILQTILQANMNVRDCDIEYFRKISNILEKYRVYKTLENKTIEHVKYSLEEQNGVIISDSDQKTSERHDNLR